MSENKNIKWPAKAIVTAGMPYGNKALHFGHVGGVFVPADCFARFLRDRIGAENVRFVSGTDCFGSPIDEGYRKAVEAGEFEGTIQDYVQKNHDAQVATLRAYNVKLDIFEGSGIGTAGKVHQEMTNQILQTLHDAGVLRCVTSKQFYDEQAGMFLNGRQVKGRCPFAGCKSEKAYADECDMGHQFAPEDLIAPHSSVTGTVPVMRDVKNWYFDLPAYRSFLSERVAEMREDAEMRDVVPNSIAEFLAPPIVFIKNECYDEYKQVEGQLPEHTYKPAEGNKQSFTIEFSDIYQRDVAKALLTDAGIRFRTGKTLVPFRLTGNAAWGVKAPELVDEDGTSDPNLTVWCWPESLWAPISFTKACEIERCEAQAEGAFAGSAGSAASSAGCSTATDAQNSWRQFWCSDDACVYQFIGQDNIYFYGVAQPALFDALGDAFALRQTRLVANHHLLFGKTKASSSGAVKPPSADELLEYYTPEQLRAHWLALGLAQKSVGFSPKPFEADESKRNDPRVADPVLKEGALLTNVFNRLARSCFYECASNFDCCIPNLQPSDEVYKKAQAAIARYETAMHKVELYSVMQIMDEFIRDCNKYWADNIARVAKDELAAGVDVREGGSPSAARAQILADSFYLLYICTVLMHPIVPAGTEKIAEMLNFGEPGSAAQPEFFSWSHIYEPVDLQVVGGHEIKQLPPRTDFFRKHECQYKK